MARPGMAVAGIAFIGLAALLVFGWGPLSAAQHVDEVGEPVDTIELASSRDDVTIRVVEGADAQVDQRVSYLWRAPDSTFSVDDGTLVLEGCGSRCGVEYEVTVPRTVDVTGESRSGNVDLTGVDEVELESRSGDVTLRDARGPVDVTTRSGDVTIDRGLPGHVTAEARSGNVEVRVPAGDYQVHGSSRRGTREVSVLTDPNAEHELDLDTRSGNVTVERS